MLPRVFGLEGKALGSGKGGKGILASSSKVRGETTDDPGEIVATGEFHGASRGQPAARGRRSEVRGQLFKVQSLKL